MTAHNHVGAWNTMGNGGGRGGVSEVVKGHRGRREGVTQLKIVSKQQSKFVKKKRLWWGRRCLFIRKPHPHQTVNQTVTSESEPGVSIPGVVEGTSLQLSR